MQKNKRRMEMDDGFYSATNKRNINEPKTSINERIL